MARVFVCGVINWDTLLFVENLPAPGEEVKVNRVTSVPGGKGSNTAVAAARILGPTKVGIIGMVGSDNVAERQVDILENEGVDTSLIMRHADSDSGKAYVIIDSDGENMILTSMAANELMTSEKIITQEMLSAIDRSDMMIIVDPPLDVAANLATKCRDRGKTAIVSPALLIKNGLPVLREYMSNADYVILNEHEAISLVSANDGVTACSRISDTLQGKKIITTLGSKGCVFCFEGKKAIIPTMDLSHFELKIKSTVGAGDTFLGALAAFKLEGINDLESIFLANIGAALKTTREETMGSPLHEDIMRYADHDYMRSLYAQIKII